MANCIFQTTKGLDKSLLNSVTATAKDVLKGKVIVDSNGNPLTGTIESMGGQTITPSSGAKTVSCNGKYMTGNITIKGDSNLVAGNIVSGKSIFGVAGNIKNLITKMGSGTPTTNKKKYNQYPKNVDYFYHLDVSLGFYPRAYGYDCGRGKGHGIYDEFSTFRVEFNYTAWDFLVDSNLINGNTIYFPLDSRIDAKQWAAGYY